MRDLRELGVLVLGFVPWLIFLFISGHTLTSLERATIISLVASLTFGFMELRRGYILQWGTLVFFCACAVLVNLLQVVWVATHMDLVANTAIAAIMWLTIVVGKPFALQYARSDLPKERWNDPKLIQGCRFVTLVWACLMSTNAGLSFLRRSSIVSLPEQVYFYATLCIILAGLAFTSLFKRRKRRQHEMAQMGSQPAAQLRSLSLIAVFAGGLLLHCSAAVPESAELKLRDKWVARHFDGKAAAVPFSFTYDARPSGELLPAWKMERAKARPGETARTLTWDDTVTGLRVRAEVKTFADLPAVEWVLRFENRGEQDTPILERVLPLDVAVEAPAQERVVIHHSLGEKNTAQSFAPVRMSWRRAALSRWCSLPPAGAPPMDTCRSSTSRCQAPAWRWLSAGPANGRRVSSGLRGAKSRPRQASSWCTANCTRAKPSARRASCWSSGRATSPSAATISCGRC